MPSSEPVLPSSNLDVDQSTSLDDEATANHYLRVTFDAIHEGITIYNADFRLVVWNKKFAEMGLIAEDELKVGYSLLEGYRKTARRGAFGPGDAEQLANEHITQLQQGKAAPEEQLFTNGRTIRIRRSYLEGGGICAVFSDITDEISIRDKLNRQANIDSLTNLPNKAFFTSELERACHAAERDGTKLAVLFLDLDHFKDVNDTLGHSVGDKLLIEVGSRLKSCLRQDDLVARFGGDEFVMVIAQPFDLTSLSSLADRLTKVIAEPYDIDGLTVLTCISIGIAIYPDDGLDIDRILANADLALYTAKRAGRHTWRVFNCRLQERLQAQRYLDQQLRHALDRHQFALHYQPLVDISDDSVVGFEALIRWNHPERGQILPDAFIPATEQNRLIIPLTEWVLEEATTQLGRWASIGLNEQKITINVSPILLKLQGFVDLVDRCMTTNGCNPSQLVIEITEEALVDEANIISVLMALRERSVTIAIDDFGTGYSSMARLKSLPIDILKIDRSFLALISNDASDAIVVESLVNVGHGLGKRVVAEGVETAKQLKFLKDVGCDIAQGFFINRPMPAADIAPWFKRRQLSRPECSRQTKT